MEFSIPVRDVSHGRLRFALMQFLSVLPRSSRGALVLYKGRVCILQAAMMMAIGPQPQLPNSSTLKGACWCHIC